MSDEASPRADVQARAEAEAARFRLGLLARPRGSGLSRLSPQAGASTEFRDHRDYVAGDDLRHIDWRAFARTDRLMVKRFFEESLPDLLLLVDRSGSMSCDPAKTARADRFMYGLASLGKQAGMRVEVAEVTGLDPASLRSLRVRPGAAAVLISDLLCPEGQEGWMRLLRGCAGVAVLQVLGDADLQPQAGTVRLTDAETGEVRDLLVDQAMIRRYLERLQRLGAEVEAGCRGRGWSFVRMGEWEELAREGVVVVR